MIGGSLGKRDRSTCDFCGKPFGGDLPFSCKFCGGKFCTEHRLPESHECIGLKEHKERVKRGEVPLFEEKKVKKEIKPKKIVPDFDRVYGLEERLRRMGWKKWVLVLIVISAIVFLIRFFV